MMTGGNTRPTEEKLSEFDRLPPSTTHSYFRGVSSNSECSSRRDSLENEISLCKITPREADGTPRSTSTQRSLTEGSEEDEDCTDTSEWPPPPSPSQLSPHGNPDNTDHNHFTEATHPNINPQAPPAQPPGPKGTVTLQASFSSPRLSKKEMLKSDRGTIRGVKHRVRTHVSSMQMIQCGYRAQEAGLVVVYTTSVSVVRATYEDCLVVRKILHTLMVRYSDRDISRSRDYKIEMAERCGPTAEVPQVFAGGLRLGGVNELRTMNENGKLRELMKGYPSIEVVNPNCEGCGGFRYHTCPGCHGSKKSPKANQFKMNLKCMACDKDGMVRCSHCLEQQE